MKKKEKKYGLLKGILILVAVAFVLTWIIPAGGFGSTGYTETGMMRLGLYDIAYTIYYALSFAVDKIVVLLSIAAFYGILTKTTAYDKVVTAIAKKLNKKVAIILFSVVLAGLTSIITQTFAILIFVPFIVSILNKMKLDKMVILATTFGSILVGIMGATYGTDGISMFNYYLGYTQTIPNEMPALLIGLVLFNFFVLSLANKKGSKLESSDIFEVEVAEDKVEKTKNIIPFIIISIILLALVILGFINWNANFGLEFSNNFHEMLTEDIKIGSSSSGSEFYIFKDLLGTGFTAFGEWNNITISAILIVFTIILALCYRFKTDEFINALKSSLKKVIKPSLCIIGAYTLMIVVYQSTYLATVVSKILTLTDSFNIATMTLSSLILNIFHTDLGFTGWIMGSYLPVEYVDYTNSFYTMFTSLYGFVQFFIPTSMILGIGLVSLKVNYKDWLKFIWRFLLGMFICLLIIFILMTVIWILTIKKAIFFAFFIYTHVGIDEVLEKRNALTVMLGLKEAWNKIVDQRTETYYKAI